jgi:hypothetical protein
MAKRRERFRTLGIYLFKENISNPAQALRSGIPTKKIQLKKGSRVVGDLYIRQGLQKPPIWASFFEEYILKSELGSVQTTSAVLLIPVENRMFALTFGQGWSLLKNGSWEERFGLKVVLNCINEKRKVSGAWIRKHLMQSLGILEFNQRRMPQQRISALTSKETYYEQLLEFLRKLNMASG